MLPDHLIWQEQCNAARRIRARYGVEKALGYLLGEKLRTFMRTAGTNPDYAGSLPAFIAEIKDVFEPSEISGYLSTVRRLGPLGHAATKEQHDALRGRDPLGEDVVAAAEDVLLIQRMKTLLLDQA